MLDSSFGFLFSEKQNHDYIKKTFQLLFWKIQMKTYYKDTVTTSKNFKNWMTQQSNIYNEILHFIQLKSWTLVDKY